MKYYVTFVIIVVLAVIIAAFFFIGTPAEERLRRFDDQRRGDLQLIQSYLIDYWQAKKTLPDTLSVLEQEWTAKALPLDPETNTAYEYQKQDDNAFELCANFNTEFSFSQEAPRIYREPSFDAIIGEVNWQHSAGRNCFTRQLNKEALDQFESSADAGYRLVPLPPEEISR
jgi:hypothetical protein